MSLFTLIVYVLWKMKGLLTWYTHHYLDFPATLLNIFINVLNMYHIPYLVYKSCIKRYILCGNIKKEYKAFPNRFHTALAMCKYLITLHVSQDETGTTWLVLDRSPSTVKCTVQQKKGRLANKETNAYIVHSYCWLKQIKSIWSDSWVWETSGIGRGAILLM